MYVVAKGQPSIGPHAGVVYAGAGEIWRVFGKWSWTMTDPDAVFRREKTTPEILWENLRCELSMTIGEIIRRFPFAHCHVVIEETHNPPELREQGKVAILIGVQPQRMDEVYSGWFTLGREMVNDKSVMTIEYRPSPSANDPLQPLPQERPCRHYMDGGVRLCDGAVVADPDRYADANKILAGIKRPDRNDCEGCRNRLPSLLRGSPDLSKEAEEIRGHPTTAEHCSLEQDPVSPSWHQSLVSRVVALEKTSAAPEELEALRRRVEELEKRHGVKPTRACRSPKSPYDEAQTDQSDPCDNCGFPLGKHS